MTKKKEEGQAADAPKTDAPAKAEAAVKVQQNGVTRPKEGTTTGRVWEISDEISSTKGEPADRKTVIEKVVAEGINASTGATQYGKWRKFHGLVGEASPGRAKAETPAAPEAPAASAVVEEDGE